MSLYKNKYHCKWPILYNGMIILQNVSLKLLKHKTMSIIEVDGCTTVSDGLELCGGQVLGERTA